MQVVRYELRFDSHGDAEAARREAGAMGYGVVSGSPYRVGEGAETWVLHVNAGEPATVHLHEPKIMELGVRYGGRYAGHVTQKA